MAALDQFLSSKKNKDREVLMSTNVDGYNHIVYLKEKRNNIMYYYVFHSIVDKPNLVNVCYQYGPYEDPYVAYDALIAIINNKKPDL